MQREKTISISEVMTPDKANFTGNIHGGYILGLLDKAAYACASRYCGKDVVTLSVDRVFFNEPIHVGELVTCLASVNFVGKTSMEIGMKVLAENIQTGQIRHTNTCYFTMVAVDEGFKPSPVEPLSLDTTLEKRRFNEAKKRRERRIQSLREYQEHKSKEHKND